VNLTDPSGLSPFIPPDSIFFDASLSGPGLFVDGIRVITEGEYRMFFSLLSSGAGGLAPIGSTVELRNGGYFIYGGNLTSGELLSFSATFVADDGIETHEDMVKRTIALVIEILRSRKACRDLLAGTGSGKNPINYLLGMKYDHKIVDGGLADQGNNAETEPSLLWVLDITYPTMHLGSQFFSEAGPIGPGEGYLYPILSPDMRREKTMLHELGHGTGAKAAKHREDDNGASSARYNKEIYEKCLSW